MTSDDVGAMTSDDVGATTSEPDRSRCRLFVRFPDGRLTDVHIAALLFPSATSVQLPRAVDCEFESAGEAAAVAARLRQTEVAAGRLRAAEVLAAADRPAARHTGATRTVLRDTTRLHVRGIQRTVSVPELRQLFAGCCDVTVPANNQRGNNGYAFVQFADRAAAAPFLERQLTLDGKQLTVSYAVERNLQLASDPRYELVEVEPGAGDKRPRQNGSATPKDSDKKSATPKSQGKKWKKRVASGDKYENSSVVISS